MTTATRTARGAQARQAGLWLALAAAVVTGGCAGSSTPLPDLTAELPRVLSPQEKEEAVGALEEQKNAADAAARQIERERPK